MKRLAILLLLTAPITAPTNAQIEGISPALLAKAKAGDVDAEFRVALDYEDGEGVSRDISAATAWYLKAAQQGSAKAQYYLGCLYLFQTEPRDYSKGVAWFRKAATEGYADAETDLARFYLVGKYVPQDYALALHWYRKAASEGNPEAQAAVSSIYEHGDGVKQDYCEAYFWMSLAASNPQFGVVNEALADDYAFRRDLIGGHLGNAGVLKVQLRTRRWFVAHPPKAE